MKQLCRVFLSLIVFVLACNMFEKDQQILALHILSNGQKIKIFYIGLGATTNEVIQVVTEDKAKKDSMLKVYENYTVMNNSMIINDSLLLLCISSDSGSRRLDTFYVDVSKIAGK